MRVVNEGGTALLGLEGPALMRGIISTARKGSATTGVDVPRQATGPSGAGKGGVPHVSDFHPPPGAEILDPLVACRGGVSSVPSPATAVRPGPTWSTYVAWATG